MNDLEDYLKNHSFASCQLNGYRLQLMMLTDDIVLLADTEKRLQDLLNRLEEFCSNWDPSINIKPTIIAIFNKPTCSSHFCIQFPSRTSEGI